MTSDNIKSSAAENRIIYSIDSSAVQMFAEEYMNRELTVAELNRFEHRFNDHLSCDSIFEAACDCFDEILDSD